MSYRGFGRTLISAAVGAGVAAISGSALASGFAIGTQNVSGLGNAYAGAAAAGEDASTIFYNPAGMTLLSGRQAVGALAVLKPFVGFTNNGSTTPTSPLPAPPGYSVGGNGGDAGSWAAVPTAYLSWEIMRDQLWLGLGINSPFGLKTEYDSNWVGRFHAVESDLLTVNINPSIAFKVNEMFSVGGGVSAQYIDAELTRQVAVRRDHGGGADASVRREHGRLARRGAAAALGGCAAEGESKGQGGRLELGVESRRDDQLLTPALDSVSPTAPPSGTPSRATPHSRTCRTTRRWVRHRCAGRAERCRAAASPPTIEVPASFSVAFSHQFADGLQVLADYTWTGWDSIQDLTINRSNGAAPTVESR